MNDRWKTSAVQDIQVADEPGQAVGTEFLLYETEDGQASAEKQGGCDAA